MFKIIDKPEFTHDVPVMVPVDDGHEERPLRTRFRALSQEELDKFDITTPEGMKALLDAVVVRFEDVADARGEPVDYSEELRARLMGHAFIRHSLFQGYVRAVTKVRLGN